MHKYLEKTGELSFDKIFNQRLGMHVLFSLTVMPEKCFIIKSMQQRYDY